MLLACIAAQRDIYFSSKGHDAPGHYAVLFSLGIITEDQLINLRRLGAPMAIRMSAYPELKPIRVPSAWVFQKPKVWLRLNRIDLKWLEETVGDRDTVFALDNHSQFGGLGDSLLNTAMSLNVLRNKKIIKFAIEEHPACGTPPEALRYHKLDGESLAGRILSKR